MSGPELDREVTRAVPGGDPLDFGEVGHRLRTGPSPATVLGPAERQLRLGGDGLIVDVHSLGIDARASAKPR